ncbi:unnamed protein product [Fusarium graminearum]|uniref:Uncharacterized protein n=1 Tax=Gibberella zeae TaxID=5518 RepID=A0A4E9DYI4_GIBZA|nr:unnamed protein product [Fusarium graminearum]CAF3647131.1 unnamed protein product [Fusarium graminearum]CAG1964793.1 unnamed protein product [Fusarium graminearum]CAG1973796.1 unnamed protein product [Fusarium graminearum]
MPASHSSSIQASPRHMRLVTSQDLLHTSINATLSTKTDRPSTPVHHIQEDDYGSASDLNTGPRRTAAEMQVLHQRQLVTHKPHTTTQISGRLVALWSLGHLEGKSNNGCQGRMGLTWGQAKVYCQVLFEFGIVGTCSCRVFVGVKLSVLYWARSAMMLRIDQVGQVVLVWVHRNKYKTHSATPNQIRLTPRAEAKTKSLIGRQAARPPFHVLRWLEGKLTMHP